MVNQKNLENNELKSRYEIVQNFWQTRIMENMKE